LRRRRDLLRRLAEAAARSGVSGAGGDLPHCKEKIFNLETGNVWKDEMKVSWNKIKENENV